MINYNNKLYTISKDVVFKQRTKDYDNKNNVFNLYVNYKPYFIKGLSAELFKYLISGYIYDIDDCEEDIEKFNIAINSLINRNWAVELKNKDDIKYCKSKAMVPLNAEGKYYFLNLGFRTIDEVSEEVYEAVKFDNYKKLDKEDLDYLLGRRYIKFDKNDEMQSLINRSNYANVYIIFSYKCNMRCIYCFEGKENRFYKEEELTSEEIISMIDKISDGKDTVITLYGGEPLLNSNMNKIHYLIKWSKEKENISFRIITNGTNVKLFMPEFIAIKDKICEFIITVDGPAKVHDQRRFFANGQHSFDKIMESIKILTENKMKVCIRINLDRDNIEHQYNFLKYLCQADIDKEYLSVVYYRVENKNDPSFNSVSYEECFDLYKKIEDIKGIDIIFGDPILSLVVDMARESEPYPYIRSKYCSLDKTYVIDCDGKVYYCNESMGILDFSRNISSNKGNNIIENNHKCLECNLYYGCYGGCTLKRYNYKKNYNIELCERKEIINVLNTLCKYKNIKCNYIEKIQY